MIFLLYLLYTVPTEAPRNVSVTINSSRSIMLTWERPSLEEENGLLVRYHVVVMETQIHYMDDGTEITGMQRYLNRTYNVSEGRAQIIDDLHPDYNYTVMIAAVTGPGIGPFSDPVTNRTYMDGELMPLQIKLSHAVFTFYWHVKLNSQYNICGDKQWHR